MSPRERYTFTGTLNLETPLHIGSGWSNEMTDATVLKNTAGTPVIPGSSLKGALRSSVEGLAGALGKVRSCQLSPQALSNTRCLTVDEDWQRKYEALQDRQAGEQDIWNFLMKEGENGQPTLCDTCLLFGSPYLASRVLIADLHPSKTTSDVKVTEVRHGVGIDRDTHTARAGVKFDFEAVPATRTFAFELICEVPGSHLPRDYGLPLLAAGLRQMQLGLVPLGGNSSRGTGRCTLNLTEIVHVDFSKVDHLRQWLGLPVANSQNGAIRYTGQDITKFLDSQIGQLLAPAQSRPPKKQRG